ncbi:hypothetical protein D9V86_11970 [Bacteroidetes/Chlorobi group bacterium ChocPot_Mid]|nr:MAG: hypothetical protein D9V86_11970 [Bacteroidetes/Chlorobi group bacterium ChocPot_Mid]
MKQIETLSSIKGRKILFELFKELRYEKQLSTLIILLQTWRVCTYEKDLFRYMKDEVTVLHPLGFFSGTTLWMQEIVNRFYFSTINSFVYFGAALLLALIGIRRFSEHVSNTMVIIGVAFEALMLLFMFLIMLFTPNDEVLDDEDEEEEAKKELLIEIGEIGREMAAAVTRMEDLTNSVEQLITQQRELISVVSLLAKSTADTVAPNPQMLETMKATNTLLSQFKDTVESFNLAANKLRREEIESSVKKEVERILLSKL